MKICIVTSSYPHRTLDPAATAGLFVRSFAQELAKLGAEVHVLTQARNLPAGSTSSSGVHLVTYPWTGEGRRASYLRPYKPQDMVHMYSLVRQGQKRLDQLHEEHSFDHVFAMWAAVAGYQARALQRTRNVPYSVWCLGSDIWIYGKYPIFGQITGSIVREARHAYADGYQLADDAAALSGRKVEFLASSRKLDPQRAEAINLQTEAPHFVCIGRYARVKGIDVLLEAFADYRQAGGLGHLYVFGGGPEESSLRSRAGQADLENCVTVGGYADEKTVVNYLTASHTAIIPSRNESIPVILSDALQLGAPVIATDVGDMGHVVRQLNAGWVVPPDSVSELSRALALASLQRRVLEPTAISHFDIAESARRFLDDISAP